MNRRRALQALALLTTAPILLPERRGFVGWTKGVEGVWYPGWRELLEKVSRGYGVPYRTLDGWGREHGGFTIVQSMATPWRADFEKPDGALLLRVPYPYFPPALSG